MKRRFIVRQHKPYRTRIQFKELRSRRKLCAVISRSLLSLPGVDAAEARPSSGSVVVVHRTTPVLLDSIIKSVVAEIEQQGETLAQQSVGPVCLPSKTARKQYHVSGTMLLLSGVYLLYLFGRRLFLSVSRSVAPATPLLSLPTLVTLGLSLPVQRQAVDNLKRTGKPDMGLISTGLLYVSLLTGNVLTALTIFWLFNLSSWLESRITTRTRQAIREMLSGKAEKVWLVQDGVEVEVPVEELQPGDIISLRLGSGIAVDGQVVEGEALVNESSMTGESLPVVKKVGDAVFAGTVVDAGQIDVVVEKTGEATRLAAIIRLIEGAEKESGELQRLSEQFSQTMVPVSLTLATLALLFTGSLLQAMAVLIITCPCAIRLSTSVAVSASLSTAAGQAILIKGGRYIETAGRVNVLVVDKTGTLTEANSEIEAIYALDKRYQERTVLQLAASVQKTWAHPLSRAIVEQAAVDEIPLRPATRGDFVVGQGVVGEVDSKEVVVGSSRFLESRGIVYPKASRDAHEAVRSSYSDVLLGYDGRVIGGFQTRSRLAGNLRESMNRLRGLGLHHIVVLTGDQEQGARGLKEKIGCDEVLWEQSPEDKAAWIQQWKAQHPDDVIAMVGDGINDTPAFALSDLSFAVGQGGSDITVEYGDIVLQKGGIDKVADTLDFGQKTLRVIKESYSITLGMNGIILMLTVLGLLPPVAGALLHNMITVTAVANASTLRKTHLNKNKK